jgi:hypothetical protein
MINNRFKVNNLVINPIPQSGTPTAGEWSIGTIVSDINKDLYLYIGTNTWVKIAIEGVNTNLINCGGAGYQINIFGGNANNTSTNIINGGDANGF